jgi:hypothetical protein
MTDVMSALRGENPTIKSEIAFAALKKLLTAFEPDNSELRILKELTILDQYFVYDSGWYRRIFFVWRSV